MAIRPNAYVLSLCCAAALCGGAVRAESYRCVTFDYPPLAYLAGDGRPDGMAVALVRDVFQHLGHQVDIAVYPWPRALAMVRSGAADCIFTIYQTAERAAFLDFSQEALARQVVYLYARRDGRQAASLEELPGLRVGVARQLNYGPRFEALRAALLLDEAPTVEQTLRKLAVGRVDVVPSNEATALAILGRSDFAGLAEQIIQSPQPVDHVPSYIAFARNRRLEGLREAFDAEMRRLAGSAEYRRLQERYLVPRTGAP